MDGTELVDRVDLCRSDGRLNPAARGWSRRPLQHCALPGGRGRRKRWDYWNVVDEQCIVAVTLADVDYLGMASVWILDRASSEAIECVTVVPLGRGIDLDDQVGIGTRRVARRRLSIEMSDDVNGTSLVAEGRVGERRLSVDIRVDLPQGHESLNVVIPWSDTRFQFTSKQLARPARGSVHVDGRDYRVGEAGPAFGTLDAGRGKWPYRSRWNWGAAAGRVEGSVVGLQLGGQWTDGTGATENGILVDGRLHKISDDLDWLFDRRDHMAPWTVRTRTGTAVDLTFDPVYQRIDGFQAIVASSDVHQCFGHYSGTVAAGDVTVEIDGLFGWAEEAVWRW